MKKALITGIFGQDGSYLCEILTFLKYEVFGIVKNIQSENSLKIKQYLTKKKIFPTLYSLDLRDYDSLKSLLLTINPNEIYHLAASHLSSEEMNTNHILEEKNIFDDNLKATSNILAICHEFLKATKIITAGSCLMFDSSDTKVQDESTPFKSNSLYGLAKIAENSLVSYYRNKDLFCSTAILYNHESSRRKDFFVVKKIVKNMVAIKKGFSKKVTLGSLNYKKDWGYAKDYAYGIYLMSKADEAQDFILSSFQLHSIKDFIKICANILEISDWNDHIVVDSSIVGRKVSTTLLGNNSKAKNELNWRLTLTLKELAELMIKNELTGELV
jgi:GDPmannose 4,6-dehydratase